MTRNPNKATLENKLDNIMKKAKPAPADKETADPDKAHKRSRSLPLILATLAIVVLFSVNQVPAPPITITGPIAAITVDKKPEIQSAGLTKTTAPLTVIQNQPGFHCYAGCSFWKPPRPLEPFAPDETRDI